MRVLICGDRKWDDAKFIYRVMRKLTKDEDVVIEGEASGADLIARIIAELRDIEVEKYPADWCDFGADPKGSGTGCKKVHQHYGIRAGMERNKRMLNANPNEVWGFHDSIGTSKGTKGMLKIAVEAGVPCRLYSHNLDPDGVILPAEWRG